SHPPKIPFKSFGTFYAVFGENLFPENGESLWVEKDSQRPMVILSQVKLAVFAVPVVINEGHSRRAAGVGLPFPLEPQLKLLIGHSPRFALHFQVVAEIFPGHRAEQKGQ